MKNSSDTNGKRARDLPACSAVLQLTAPPRVRNNSLLLYNYSKCNDIREIYILKLKYSIKIIKEICSQQRKKAVLLFRFARCSI